MSRSPGPVPIPATLRLRQSLRASTAEGIAAELVGASAGGAVLTAWAMHLQAGALAIGILGSLPFCAQFVHLPAAWITAWFGRRRVALAAVAASRQAWLPLVALPFLPLERERQLAVVVAVAALSSVLGAIGNNAWVAWMGELVPARLRGRYFGQRTALCMLGGTVFSLGAGHFLDLGRAEERTGPALAALAAVACLAGAVTTLLMARQHDPNPPRERETPPLAAAAEPLSDPRARQLLAYLVAWNAAVGVAGPFFTIHMVENLQMSFGLVALQGAGVTLLKTVTSPIWGRAVDRFGARPVLATCSHAIAAIPLVWLFATPQTLWPVAVDALLSGLLWSGHGLAAFSLPLSVAPPGRSRPLYLGTFLAAGGLAYGAASAAGGLLTQLLPREVEVLGRPVFALQVLFVSSALTRLLAARLIGRFVEPAAQPARPWVDVIAQRASALGSRLLAPPRVVLRAIKPLRLEGRWRRRPPTLGLRLLPPARAAWLGALGARSARREATRKRRR